ncbi:MAG: class I SAM-dependent methyltransferase [archaeon]|nr:class I SAM-dependent methyltransferase [archaeon]
MGKLDRLFAETGPLEGLAILEPGCGTGRLTEILATKVGTKGHIVALDISPKMVETARRRMASRQNVEVHLAEVEAFPLQDGGFDLVLCHQVFPHFEDKEKALKILVRALKPGGRFIIFHFMNLSQINDLHRKAGTAVENDMMPMAEEMKHLFEVAGLKMEFLKDDSQGYIVSAKRFY